MPSPFNQDTADSLLQSGVITPDTYAMHQSAGWAPPMTPADGGSLPDAPSEFKTEFDKRKAQITAPSPFDRPDAPQLSPDALDQAAASGANGIMNKHADDLTSKYKDQVAARDFLKSQGVPDSELDKMAPITAAKPPMSTAGLTASLRGPELRGEMVGRDSVGVDPSRLVNPGAQPQAQGAMGNPIADMYGKFTHGQAEESAGVNNLYGAMAKGAQAKSQAQASLSNQMESDAQDHQRRIQDAAAQTDSMLKDLQAESDKYAKSPGVDPNRVWHNAGTGTKIAAAVSLALGGLGGALTGHGGNAAMDIINKTIDRDIEAQKMDIEKNGRALDQKKSMFGLVLQKTGNMEAAIAAQKSEQYRAAAAKIDSIASSTEGQALPAQAQMMKGQLEKAAAQSDMQFKGELFKYNMMTGAMNGAGPGAGGGVDPRAAIQRINYGPESQEIKGAALKELPEYQKHEANKQLVTNALDDMYKYSTDFTPNGQQRFKTAKTAMLSDTAALFGGKSDNEFKIMDGWVPGMTMSAETLQHLKNTAMQKLDSQAQFPVLTGMGLVRPTFKLENHK